MTTQSSIEKLDAIASLAPYCSSPQRRTLSGAAPLRRAAASSMGRISTRLLTRLSVLVSVVVAPVVSEFFAGGRIRPGIFLTCERRGEPQLGRVKGART